MLSKLLQPLSRYPPSSCIVCGLSANRDFSICIDCEIELPMLGTCCEHCGIELNGIHCLASNCASCQINPPSFDFCAAAFPYASPINKLIADFKFAARFDIGYSLSRMLAQAFNAYYADGTKPELLLPVPLHGSRLRSRGFNQAQAICNVLSTHCRVPTAHSVLTKVRKTEPQTSMKSAAARKRNLRGAFAVAKRNCLEDVTHIALVDDVVTTMTTVEVVANLLQKQGRCRVDVWCLARAGR